MTATGTGRLCRVFTTIEALLAGIAVMSCPFRNEETHNTRWGSGVSELKKSMGAIAGTFMALSAVLGSGMMILPGVSYHQLDRAAWLPWAIAAVSVIPLLCCYAWLGRRYPAASGVAYYAEVALGRTAGQTVGMIAAIGLVAAIPATAITGGRYLAQYLGIGAAAWVFPIVVIAGATAVGCVGINVSSKLQVGLILALFVTMAGIAMVALSVFGFMPPSTELPAHGDLGSVLTAVYVAFTGWETVAFTFEEHKRSDLIPRIFALSYVIVVVLYGLLLFGLFAAADAGDGRLNTAPLLVLAQRSLGDLALPATLALVVACITANVLAAMLALSRLVFGLARSGYLPIALRRVRARDQNPSAAVLAVGVTLLPVAVLAAVGLFSFEVLFSVTGGLYFVLYGVGVAAFALLAKGSTARVGAVIGAVTVVGVTFVAGQPMWVSWAVFALALCGVAVLGRRKPVAAVPAIDDTSETVAFHAIDARTVRFRAVEPRTVRFSAIEPSTVQFGAVDDRTVEFPRVPRPTPMEGRARYAP